MTDENIYPKFPHLENLDRVPYVLEAPEFFITEKLHGFNARFGRTDDGVFWVGTRNQLVTDDAQGFTTWALQHDVPQMWRGVTVYGEWIGKGIQKGVDYGDEKRFRAFAVRDRGGMMHPDSAAAYVRALDIEWVPTIYAGPNPGIERLDEWRRQPTRLGTDPSEGIVIVPWPPVFDKFGNQIIAKFKNPAFEERKSARKEAPAPADLSSVQAFVDEYATDERLSHVLDQLSERGVDGLDRANTGELLRAYYNDIVREGSIHHATLSESDQKAVGRVLNPIVKGLADARRVQAVSA